MFFLRGIQGRNILEGQRSKLKPGEAAKELVKKYDIKLPNDYNPVQQVLILPQITITIV